jgi:hypothetical protein
MTARTACHGGGESCHLGQAFFIQNETHSQRKLLFACHVAFVPRSDLLLPRLRIPCTSPAVPATPRMSSRKKTMLSNCCHKNTTAKEDQMHRCPPHACPQQEGAELLPALSSGQHYAQSPPTFRGRSPSFNKPTPSRDPPCHSCTHTCLSCRSLRCGPSSVASQTGAHWFTLRSPIPHH